MGRLKDRAYRPFERQRYKGITVPDYVSASLLGDVLSSPSLVKPAGAAGIYPVGKKVEKVAVDNGYYMQLMRRQMSAIDFTDEWLWDTATIQTGPVTVLKKRVPRGLAWHIDNMYFYARAIGGVTGSILLNPASMFNLLLLRVFTSSSQLKYESYEQLLAGLPKTSFPFLNDRIGPREGKFGVTLYEGEVIRAFIQARQAVVVPVAAIVSVGFRFMGIEGTKAQIQDYLELKRWDGTS